MTVCVLPQEKVQVHPLPSAVLLLMEKRSAEVLVVSQPPLTAMLVAETELQDAVNVRGDGVQFCDADTSCSEMEPLPAGPVGPGTP